MIYHSPKTPGLFITEPPLDHCIIKRLIYKPYTNKKRPNFPGLHYCLFDVLNAVVFLYGFIG